jgi:hypothetical protein
VASSIEEGKDDKDDEDDERDNAMANIIQAPTNIGGWRIRGLRLMPSPTKQQVARETKRRHNAMAPSEYEKFLDAHESENIEDEDESSLSSSSSSSSKTKAANKPKKKKQPKAGPPKKRKAAEKPEKTKSRWKMTKKQRKTLEQEQSKAKSGNLLMFMAE